MRLMRRDCYIRVEGSKVTLNNEHKITKLKSINLTEKSNFKIFHIQIVILFSLFV